MTFADIGWLVSSIVWVIFAILNFVANHRGDTSTAFWSLNGMFISLGFIFVFLGLINGWW
jgi:hypothetical protein